VSTMVDVALAAGVSVGTVSNVVRNTRPVSEATRARVIDAIRQLDYRPNAVAGALKRGATRTLGFVIPDLLNPYYSTLAIAVERCARQAGFSILVANTNGEVALEAQQVTTLVERRVDGVIFPSLTEGSTITAELLDRGIPVVCLGVADDDPRVGIVDIDDELGMELALEHLVTDGHQHVGFLYSLVRDQTIERRPRALADALRKRGLTLARIDDAPTALCCTNDVVALAALDALLSADLQVPDTLSVVGFDDIPMARHAAIGLTTVRVDAARTGEIVIDLLLNAITDGGHVSRRVTLTPELVTRATTGPPSKCRSPANTGRMCALLADLVPTATATDINTKRAKGRPDTDVTTSKAK